MNTTPIIDCLRTMSRSELSATAKTLGLPVGKSKSNTMANLIHAIVEKKARFTLQFTIRKNTDPAAHFVPAIFSKKLRTHKADKVIIRPSNPGMKLQK